MKLAELGEFGLIERLRRLVGRDPDGLLGIGDDCAAWALPAGKQLLVSTDLLLEGTHFRRDWTDMYRLGRKAVAVNLSDIAAMGGTPGQLVLGLGLPVELELADIDALLEGFVAAAREYGVALVGGDTCRAQQFLAIAVTAFGTIEPDLAIRRDTARPGDLVFVSGSLGDSALALRRLRQDEPLDPYLQQRHFDPVPRIELGRQLAARGLVTAMLDLSDGLVSDLSHLLQNRVTGAVVKAASLPLSDQLQRALEIEADPIGLALYGGEEYELLFAAPAANSAALCRLGEELGVAVTPIGQLVNDRTGVWLEDAGGKLVALANQGFQHFSNDSAG